MAVLTWREVSKPDFSSASQSLNLANKLRSDALGSISEGLTGFQKADQDANSAAIMQRALAITDPEIYKQALASGELLGGLDVTRFNPNVLTSLNQRSNELTDQAFTEARRANILEEATLQKQGREAMNAASPAIRNLLGAARTGDNAGISQALQDPSLQGLPADQYLSLVNSAGDVERNALNTRNAAATAQNNIEREAAQREAADFILRAKQSSVNNQQYQSYLSGNVQKLSPAAQRIVGAQMGFATPGEPVSSAGFGTQQGNPYDALVGWGKFGKTDKPLTEMTLGEAMNFGKQVLIPNTRNSTELGLAGTGKGSSAMGAYQITQGTLQDFAPRVLGKDWQNQKFTPEVQDKLAEAIYNERRSGNLKETFAGLPDRPVGYWKNIPWSQARDAVMRGEVGTTLAEFTNNLVGKVPPKISSELLGLSVQNKVGQEQSNSISGMFAEALKNAGVADTVLINKAVGKGGVLEGVDSQWLANEIQAGRDYVKDKTRTATFNGVEVPTSVAIAALAQSRGGQQSGLGKSLDSLTSWFTGSRTKTEPNDRFTVNDDRYKALLLEEYAKGMTEQRVVANNERNRVVAELTTAAANLKTLEDELKLAQEVAKTNPNVAARLPNLVTKFKKATEDYNNLARAAESSASIRYTEPKPEPKPKPKAEPPKKAGTVMQQQANQTKVPNILSYR